MKLTNLLGLSDDVVAAVSADRYDPGRPADVPPERYFTTTQLIQPEQIQVLKERHRDELVEDVADRIYSLLGDSVHLILERVNSSPYDRIVRARREIRLALANLPEDASMWADDALSALRIAANRLRWGGNVLRERRLYMKVDVDGVKYTIGGALDNLHIKDGILTDWKLTSIFSTKDGAKSDWILQNRINSLLCDRNNYPIKKAQNCVIYRDWRKAEAMRKPDSYPQKQVEELVTDPIPHEQTLDWIKNKIRRVVAARKLHDECLPECTASERWQKADIFAVKKLGGKRAEKGGVFVDATLAEEFRASLQMTKGGAFEIEVRPGISKKCEMYCQVMPFCSQARRLGVGAESAEVDSDG